MIISLNEKRKQPVRVEEDSPLAFFRETADRIDRYQNEWQYHPLRATLSMQIFCNTLLYAWSQGIEIHFGNIDSFLGSDGETRSRDVRRTAWMDRTVQHLSRYAQDMILDPSTDDRLMARFRVYCNGMQLGTYTMIQAVLRKYYGFDLIQIKELQR